MPSFRNLRFVRPKQLAEELGVSLVTLWRWEKNGVLPPKRKLGPNVVGWLESEIDTWMAERADPAN